MRAAELLDVGGDVHGGYTGKVFQASLRAPGSEGLDGLEVGAAGVGVTDIDGEELPETPALLGHCPEERG